MLVQQPERLDLTGPYAKETYFTQAWPSPTITKFGKALPLLAQPQHLPAFFVRGICRVAFVAALIRTKGELSSPASSGATTTSVGTLKVSTKLGYRAELAQWESCLSFALTPSKPCCIYSFAIPTTIKFVHSAHCSQMHYH